MRIDSFFHLNIFGFSALERDVYILWVDELSHLDPAAKFSLPRQKHCATSCANIAEISARLSLSTKDTEDEGLQQLLLLGLEKHTNLCNESLDF